MNFTLQIDIRKPPQLISYRDPVMLIGSCFTEHIGNSLQDLKFSVLQNPHGILFDPVSVCSSLVSYIENRQYDEGDLFQLNEVWHSWHHHSRFSDTDKEKCLETINASQRAAHHFLKTAGWLIITLGSSFSYRLTDHAVKTSGYSKENSFDNMGVANCHRAPASWFNKHLLGIREIISTLDNTYHRLKQFNPLLKIIYTVSPVRHIRDGVVENNRSKARLIEAVHHMVGKFENQIYFPAYEIVIDVLRDYRFYDMDLVHPNYMATEFVLQQFSENYIDEDSCKLMEVVRKIVIAGKHKPFQPRTKAHQEFLRTHALKTKELMQRFPFLDLRDELNYFETA